MVRRCKGPGARSAGPGAPSHLRGFELEILHITSHRTLTRDRSHESVSTNLRRSGLQHARTDLLGLLRIRPRMRPHLRPATDPPGFRQSSVARSGPFNGFGERTTWKFSPPYRDS